jgi:hypothetical protein
MNTETIAILIPLSAIILGIGAGIVGIVTRHRQLLQRADLRHKERLAAIEKGIELPPDPPEIDLTKPRYLLKGLIYSGVGLALYFALGAVAGEDVALFAFIPLAVGVACLIYYWVRGRHEEQPTTEAQAATRS